MKAIIMPEPTRRDSERCRNQCPRSQPCCCNGDVRHTLHICNDATCACHSRERYEGVRRG